MILSQRTRDVTPDEGERAIGWYAPAGDFGAHDFRWADRGSNLLSKGQDGYTPIGPPIAAGDAEPSSLRLCTRVNGEVVQEAGGEELLFSFGQLVADLSRFMTLERGDVVLTGTPSGAGLAEPGDVIEIELEMGGDTSTVRSTIVEGSRPLAPYGAMPRATPEARAQATGVNAPRAVTLSDDALAALRSVSTATLTAQLAKRGLASTFLAGLHPSHPELRMVGYAHTLRYVAVREDIRDETRRGDDAQKRAVEAVSPGDVLIMEARGETAAGTIGDILAARVLARGGVGIVTDGGIRDTARGRGAGDPHVLQGRECRFAVERPYPARHRHPDHMCGNPRAAGRRRRRRCRGGDDPARGPRRRGRRTTQSSRSNARRGHLNAS